MNKILIGIAILIVVAAGLALWPSNKEVSVMPVVNEQSAGGGGGRVANPEPKWTFTDVGETDNIPYTEVAVQLYGVTHDLGKYQGSCREVGATGGIDGKGLLAGEISAAQCYFAGGGDELGVFANENGGLDIMKGELGEGDAENPPFRGNFKVLLNIN